MRIKTGEGQDVHLPLLAFPAMAAFRIFCWGDE